MKISKKVKNSFIELISTVIILCIIGLLSKYGIIDLDLSSEHLNQYSEKEQQKTSSTYSLEKYKVIRVVDGDTLVIEYNGKNEKVRLIGVDTPESVHPDETRNTEFGEKVSNYSKSKLEGNEIQIEFDVQERDKYGRLLCYVYIEGQMYNKLLLKEGLAKVATYPPNIKYVDEFVKIQKQARQNGKGMWQDKYEN